MAWVRTNGAPSLRYVYKREGNRREVSVLREDGSLSHGWIDIVDNKGNEVETTNISPSSPSRLKRTYTYLEFDSQGNWIKRAEKDGDSSRIIYRTITYH
jgi:hypothetical protein